MLAQGAAVAGNLHDIEAGKGYLAVGHRAETLDNWLS